jgi:hypothetical protein
MALPVKLATEELAWASATIFGLAGPDWTHSWSARSLPAYPARLVTAQS